MERKIINPWKWHAQITTRIDAGESILNRSEELQVNKTQQTAWPSLRAVANWRGASAFASRSTTTSARLPTTTSANKQSKSLSA